MRETQARARIVTLETLLAKLRPLREAGRRVVFTNGCFDLLHGGHAQFLEEASALGDLLVVGINTDDSVRRLKGPGRPILDQEQRSHLVALIRPVDYVVLFREDTPDNLITALVPDVLVKGTDYRLEDIVGREAVEEHGGRVVRLALVPGLSTSALARRLRETPE